jgi:hypothetical protein
VDDEMPTDPKPATNEPPTERRHATPADGFITIEQLMEEQGITGPPDFDSWPVFPPLPEVDGY